MVLTHVLGMYSQDCTPQRMAGNQALSSQSLTDDYVVYEDGLYLISELAHWPQVMISDT